MIIIKEMPNMDDLFSDTMMGLLQAVNIEKGYIPVEKVPNLPAETYRVQNSFEEANSIWVSLE